MNIDKIREDFPILHQLVHGKPLVYLDSAASSQKPRHVIEAIRYFYENDNSNVHRGLHELSSRATDAYEGARARVAKFINASCAEEIVYTRGTTEGINLVAQTWGVANVAAGETILLSEMEHHSNLVPWQMLSKRTGAKLEFIPVDPVEGVLDLDAFKKLIDKKPKLLSLVHISNSLGCVNPIEEICRMARERGVTTLIDAAQSAGHRPLDVQKIGCDFLVFSGHKICAPTGIGILYGRRELLDAMPPYQGGGDMIVSVHLESSEYKPAPYKFEAGTPHIEGAVGLHAALDYLEQIGREEISKHDLELAQYAQDQLSTLDKIRIIGPKKDRAGLVSFQFDDIHAHDVVTLADQKGIALRGGHHCTQPLMRKLGLKSTARASFYFYNTRAEVDTLVQAMRETRKYFGYGS